MPEVKKAFLPYELPYMTDELRRRAKEELFEDENTRTQSLKLLRTMLEKETNLYFKDDDSFLLAFLRARKFDVKRSYNLIKTFYTIKEKHGELYKSTDYSLVSRTLEENSVGFFPYRDAEGSCILLIHAGRWNPHDNTMGDIMRALTFSLYHAIQSPATQVAGFQVIVDFKGFGVNKLPYISPTYLLLFAEALQNCFPARFKGVHIVNEGHFFTYIWSILKQFLTKKLKERFHFHGRKVNGLHKFFHPSILPEEYGGDLPSYDNSEFSKKMAQVSTLLMSFNEYGYLKTKKSED